MLLWKSSLLPGALPLSCAAILTLTLGCSGAGPSSAAAGAGGGSAASSTGSGAGGGTTSPPKDSAAIDVKHYDLKGEYDWDKGRLLATVDITLAPTAAGLKTISLDSAVTQVSAVKIAGGGALPFAASPGDEKLDIDVSGLPALEEGADITLEIAYEAAPGDALVAVTARKGDPLGVRALYTFSEPLMADQWMPCHDTPADRATFSVDMRMPADETMIANGTLAADSPDPAGGHRMRYETAYTIPTYLMAFAISDFEVESAQHGALPLTIWHRRGLPGDYPPVLARIDEMMTRFESLLGPYPFEKYALVLLPAFAASGEEHASATFQAENRGNEPLHDEMLVTAHELAHQWFGDLMTVSTWDDVWIKEGMATVLENEGVRAEINKDGPLTLNGDDGSASAGLAIRDPSLAPKDKYTSGPYSRAAWLFAQIRSLVGEDAFWKTLRGVLDQHRFGAIGTDEFISAFAEALGPAALARVKHAVDAKAIPTLELSAPASPDKGPAVVLHDPESTLVAPLDIAWVAPDGATRAATLTPEQPLELSRQKPDEILVIDPHDAHILWDWLFADDTSSSVFAANVAPLLLPSSADGLATFSALGSAAQNEALSYGLPKVAPADYKAFVATLDSEWTQAQAIPAACRAIGEMMLDPTAQAAWTSALADVLSVPPAPFDLSAIQSFRYRGACTSFDAATAFAADLAQMETGLPQGGIPYTRLSYLSAFYLPAPLALSTWGSLAKQAFSARVRELALSTLRARAAILSATEKPAWRAFFAEMLSATEDTDALRYVIPATVTTAGATAADNADAIAGLSAVVRSPWTSAVHYRAICTAFKLAKGDSAAFSAFAAGLGDVKLDKDAAAALKDPSTCQ